MDIQQLLIALAVSLLVAGLAYWRQWLAPSGVVGALIVGTLTMGFGGWLWGVLLGIFFVSSSALSHYKEEQKRQTAAEKFDKGSRRDFMQALANGGVGALIAVLHVLVPSPLWFAFFVGVMGTVNADTWATELGTLSRRPPRLITTGRVVERGTSGGVTVLGTAVSFLGGLLIGAVAGLGSAPWWLAALQGGIGGLTGSLTDSVLGATVQAIYYSDARRKETEKKVERDGTPNRRIRGWVWLNNDLVNLLSSLVGGAVAVVLGMLLGAA